MAIVNDYMRFLLNKTEGEVVGAVVDALKGAGFVDLESVGSLSRGDRVFWRHGEFVGAAVIGDPAGPMRVVVSHVDAPRLDLKPNPFVERDDYVYLKTQYYGGIKFHHWLARPLEIRGKVVTVDGEEYFVSIPTVITDFAPHLDKEYRNKTVKDAFDPERLEPLVALGKKDAVFTKIKDEFGVDPQDFLSADLEIVPMARPERFGAHREFIMAYAHDDRSSVFASLQALLSADLHAGTSVALFVDREEVGSTTAESARSTVVDLFFLKLLKKQGKPATLESLLDLYAHSDFVSADVSVGYDSLYSDLYDKENAAKLGAGVVISKYTGSGGKYYGSEASAEYVAFVRRVLEDSEIPYQSGTLGKVGKGGGGTIAVYFAHRGARIIDMGAPVLSMHAPTEVLAIADLESAYRAYRAFYEWVE
ncbi:MAG: aminopeptidase [Candidatus Diapherotrites archaeon]|nr:aminopeptidase [Candidatus Diapherotrites archaeon]